MYLKKIAMNSYYYFKNFIPMNEQCNELAVLH